MTLHLGKRAVASTITFDFTTTSYGVPTILGGAASSPDAAIVSVYKNGSTTESVTGVTLTVTYDSRNGLNHVVIDTSQDGTFYAVDNDFSVVITNGTVAGVSVAGYVVACFRLSAEEGNVAAIKTQTDKLAFTVTNQVDANVLDINGSASAAANLAASANSVPQGTATTGASTTSVPTSALTIGGSAVTGVEADQYAGGTIFFKYNTTTAGLRGAKKAITANTASNTPTFTVEALPATPASGDTFEVI